MSSQQNNVLQALSIPVWQQRGVAVEQDQVSVAVPSFNAQCRMVKQGGQVVGYVLAHHDAPEPLFSDCLRATKLSMQGADSADNRAGKFTVFFGLGIARQVNAERDLSEADLGIFHECASGPFVVTHAVAEMAADPSLKREVWRVLQMAMRRWQVR